MENRCLYQKGGIRCQFQRLCDYRGARDTWLFKTFQHVIRKAKGTALCLKPTEGLSISMRASIPEKRL